MGKREIQQDPKHWNGVLKMIGSQQYYLLFPWKLQETNPQEAALLSSI
jgi:hypothetical protein